METLYFDFVIIGSGFGGSISAMRLSQKGYRVALLESGKRYRAQDFPRSNWNIRKFLWAPLLRCFGIQKISLLKGVLLLHGSGVGGGSLVYANTLMKPPTAVLKDSVWPSGLNWDEELAPHYEESKRMLGVTKNPILGESDAALHEVAKLMGVEKTFHPTDVGVYFGDAKLSPHDPFFQGDGPPRQGCTHCGGCMVGCRYQAKNTLDQNYLHFAEKWGTQVFAETEANRILPIEKSTDGARYEIQTQISTSWFGNKKGPVFHAKNVVLAAGVLGTVRLLFKNRDEFGTLPNVSQQLGTNVRTNGESLLGVTTFDRNINCSRGIAIGSAIHPDAQTKIEAVRYPNGSSVMRFLAVPLTSDGSAITRPLKMIFQIVRRLPQILRLYLIWDWARSSVILLVMQSVDEKIGLRYGRNFLGIRTLLGAPSDKPIPSYLPKGQLAAQYLAQVLKGEPQNVWSEVLLRTPATAHILGGVCMGDSAQTGVIDLKHEVFGHPGLFVCDGSVIPANLAVNPSLTISALAERFASLWPSVSTPKTLRYGPGVMP